MLIGVPLKIVQIPGVTFILYEEFARFRQIADVPAARHHVVRRVGPVGQHVEPEHARFGPAPRDMTAAGGATHSSSPAASRSSSATR